MSSEIRQLFQSFFRFQADFSEADALWDQSGHPMIFKGEKNAFACRLEGLIQYYTILCGARSNLILGPKYLQSSLMLPSTEAILSR